MKKFQIIFSLVLVSIANISYSQSEEIEPIILSDSIVLLDGTRYKYESQDQGKIRIKEIDSNGRVLINGKLYYRKNGILHTYVVGQCRALTLEPLTQKIGERYFVDGIEVPDPTKILPMSLPLF